MSEQPGQARDTRATKIPTGVPGLDEVLGGGLKRNRLYLVLGDPGVGKTTMALQFLIEGRRQGESCLYATLSETREEIEDIADSHGWSLDGIEIVELHALYQSAGVNAIQTMFHPAEIDLEEFMAPLVQEIERVKPLRTAIDSLSELRVLAQDQRRFRRQITSIKQHLGRLGSTTLLLDDRTPEHCENVPQTFAHGVAVLEAVRREYGPPRRRMSVPKLRGARIREGYHDFEIVTGGIIVYPRLVAAEHQSRFEPGTMTSGVVELDAMLGGGLSRGTSTLITGPAGAGKSVLATQYLHAAAERGVSSVVFVFDEARETYLLRAAGAGLDLAPHLTSGRVQAVQVDPTTLTPGQFAHCVCNVARPEGPCVVVLDSLNGYLSAVPEETLLAVHLHELLLYLGQRGVVTLMTLAQHGLPGSVAASVIDVSYLADTVIMLRFFEAEGEVRKAISVPKMRRGSHELALRELRISQHGLQIGAPLRELHGVLTGTPTYMGPREPLFQQQA